VRNLHTYSRREQTHFIKLQSAVTL